MSTEVSKTSEQESAEAGVEGFRKQLGPFVVAAETTRMPMLFTDAPERDSVIIFANDSLLQLTGYSRERVLGQTLQFFLAEPSDKRALELIVAAYSESSDRDPEMSFRRDDGSVFWASIFVSPVRDEGGAVVQHFVSFIDISRHRQEQERLLYLLDELNHRTQNTLATVLAIAGQTLRGMAEARVIDAFEGRILALSKTQSLLGRESWDGVSLRDVLDEMLDPFRSDGVGGPLFSVEGEDVRLLPKAALTLGMVFHELAANALEHGALSVPAKGRVAISWQVAAAAGGSEMRLRWQETGGPAVTPPARRGFGSRLIGGGLAQELNGDVRMTFEPAGVVCDITMPLPSVAGWKSRP